MADHLLRIIIQAMDKASGPLGKVGGSAQRMGESMRNVGMSMTRNITLPIVGIGIAAVKMASDMDTAMRNVQSVGKQTDAQIAQLSDQFADMATSGEYGSASMTELARAFYDIQGAGFAGADAMEVLQASSVGATAGAADLTAVMEGITAVLNSYGKGADEAMDISDLLFRTVDRGVGSMEELSGSMSNVVGTAAAVGVPFEEVSAALATMSKQGMSFSEGTVALNQVMLAFLKPSTAMAGVLSDLGYASGLALIEEKGLAGALREVNTAVGGNASSMADMFGSVRGLRGVLALTGDAAGMFAEDLVAMGDASGAASAAMEIQMQSFANQMKLLKNTVQEAMVTIGNIIIPVLINIFNHLRPIIKAFSDLPPGIQEAIVVFLVFAAALGPILWIVGSLITVVTGLGTVLGFIPALIAGINVALLFLAANPIVLVIAAIVALGVVIALLINHFGGLDAVVDKAKEAFNRLGTWIKDTFFSDWKESLMTIFFLPQKLVYEMIKVLGKALGIGGENIIKSFVAGLLRAMASAIKAISDFGNGIVNTIKDIFQIGSPSKVMHEMGGDVSQGFIDGVYAALDAQGGNYTKEIYDRFGLNEDDPIIAAYYAGGERIGNSIGKGVATASAKWQGEIGSRWERLAKNIAEQKKYLQGITAGASIPYSQGSVSEAYANANINTPVMQQAAVALRNMVLQLKSWGLNTNQMKATLLGVMNASEDQAIRWAQTDPLLNQLYDQFKFIAAHGGQALIDGLKQSWGIASPSKVMLGLGKNLAGSLASGVETGASPVGAAASGGGVSISIGTLQVPPGTTRQQVDELMKELGRRMQQRGISGRSVG